jgi:hypothetical protein
MAYGVVNTFVGGTMEQYEASLAALAPTGDLPEGQIYHAAGPSERGWTIVEIHDSKESFERYRNDIARPVVAQGIEGGFTVSRSKRCSRSTTK